MAALLIQQAITIRCGAGLFGLAVSGLPLLAVALLAWTLALLGMGAALGVLARSLSQMSAAYDIGGMILSSLGGARSRAGSRWPSAWWQACGRAVGGSVPPPCKAEVSRREKTCPELSI